MGLTAREALEIALDWQKRLRITDWEIRVQIARQHNMGEYRRGGEIEMCRQHKTAWITIADSVDLDVTSEIADQEFFIIHELLHILLEPFFPSGGGEKFLAGEFAINALAGALLKQKRATEDAEKRAEPYRDGVPEKDTRCEVGGPESTVESPESRSTPRVRQREI